MKAIIFDFDDTLADFSSARDKIVEFLDSYCKGRYGIENFGEVFDAIDTEMTIKARTKKDPKIDNRALWAKIASKRLGVNLTNSQCQKIRKLYWKLALEKTRLLPHAKEVLKQLSKRYDLYVLSDADGEPAKEKIDRIKKLSIYRYFKGSSFGDAIGTTKPDMKFYTYLIKRYEINPKECIMVGDKPQYDLEPAKKLGMKTVWMKYGRWADVQKQRFKYVDFAIKNLRGLLKITK